MNFLKKSFFMGTTTSGIVLFLYETLKPFDVNTENPTSLVILLAAYAVFFTMIGALIPFFGYMYKKRVLREYELEEAEKSQGRSKH